MPQGLFGGGNARRRRRLGRSLREEKPLLNSRDVQILKQLSRGTQKLWLNYSRDGKSLGKDMLREALKRYNRVRTIKFANLSYDTSLKHLKRLSGFSKTFSNVRNIDFGFKMNDSSETEGSQYRYLERFISKLPNLRYFTLASPYNLDRESFKKLEHIGRGLKNSRFLEKINLELKKFQSIVFGGLGKGLKGMNSRADVNIQFVDLCGENLGYTYVKEKKMFESALKECEFLPQLKLQFLCWDKGDDRGMKMLTENLKKFCKIKHLRFDFPVGVENEIQHAFIKELENLSSLETLNLVSQPYGQPDPERLFLVSQTLKKLKKLKKLNLESQGASDEGLDSLGQVFEELPSLKSVDIGLIYDPEPSFTNKGFLGLKDGLRKAKYVENLVLYFHNFEEIYDQDIKQLMGSLEELTSLRTVELHFTIFPKITDEVLQAISQNLKKMPFLQKFRIGLCETEVTEEAATLFMKELKELPLKTEFYFNRRNFE